MTTTAPTHEQQASEFAAAVRAHLEDLPETELDELLDGLQADLAERLADGGELGDPRHYADELRQAAGLPERGSGAPRRPRRSLGEAMRDAETGLVARIRDFWAATSGRRAVRDFVISLRPLWWVLRGAVVAMLLLWMFGHPVVNGLPLSFPALLLTAALVVLSVQWGRGSWTPRTWLVVLRRVASTVAVIALLPVTAVVWNAMASPHYIESEPYEMYGLSSNGERIDNIFAFDCTGRPIDGVQLFDQHGRPITTVEGEPSLGGVPAWGLDEETQDTIVYQRNGLAAYAGLWNVFPLQEARAGQDRDPISATPKDAEWPMDETLPISPQCATGEAAEEEAADSADSGAVGASAASGAEGAAPADAGTTAGGDPRPAEQNRDGDSPTEQE